jgi:hypothetical protein
MDPIVLTEFETLVVTNLESEEQKVPFDSPSTYMGHLENGNVGNVCAAKVSATHYIIFVYCFGTIGQPIPVEIDTFAKLRQWCLGRIKEKELWETRLRVLWGLVPLDVQNRIESNIAAEEEARKMMQRAHRDAKLCASDMIVGNDDCASTHNSFLDDER